MPIRSLRRRRSSSSDFEEMSSSWTRIRPAVGSISRLMWRISVDFPLPDNPMTQKISPSATEKLASATPTTQSKRSRTSDLERFCD